MSAGALERNSLSFEQMSLYRRFFLSISTVSLACVLRMLHLTLRYQYFRVDHRSEAESLHPSGSFCSALWHQNSLASLFAHQDMNIRAMVSNDLNGDLFGRLISAFGFGSIRSHSSGSSRQALGEISRRVPNGCKLAMTVDGPRGPRHEVKSGIIIVAASKGIPILPVAAVPDRYWEIGTWDKFRVPKPFAKVRVMYGAPIHLPKEDSVADSEKAKIQISQALHRIERQMARFRVY